MRARHAALGLLLVLTYSVPGAGKEPAPAGQGAPPRAAGAAPAPASPAAQGAADADASAAAHYLAGTRAAEAGRFEEAYRELLQAWRLKQHFQIAANLGMTELQTRRFRDAAEHLAYFLREARGMRPGEIRQAEEMLKEARRHVGALTVEVEPAGAEILVDGQPAGAAPLGHELFVEPGRRSIEVRRAGFAPARSTVDARAGEARSVRLALQPLPQAREARPAPAPRRAGAAETPAARGEPVYWPAMVAGGLALGGIGLGVGFTVAANSRSAEAQDVLQAARAQIPNNQVVCPHGATTPTCARVSELLEEKDRFSNAAVAGYVVGGLAAVATAGLVVWAPRRPGGGLEARVAPDLSLEGGGLRVKGTF